jgi:hypothetical protein
MLTGQQTRQLIDTQQLYETLQSAELELDHSFRGSMAWKRVSGRDYLYRKREGEWQSLGGRSRETEQSHEKFHQGRAAVKARIKSLLAEIERMAPINRAMGLGRVPWLSGRILRRLDRQGLLGHGLRVVGTHAMYAYEGLASVHFAGEHVTTVDIDLLYDARASLRLAGPELARTGLIGQLRKVDRSFKVERGGFRAANDDGFLVDLIAPQPRFAATRPARSRIGDDEDDQAAAEIEGLAWLQNSPGISRIVLDEKGFPLRMFAPDPRAFAIHKAWLSDRSDREPGKRRRDLAQARAVANMLGICLPELRFDDPVLHAFPGPLRERGLRLAEQARSHLPDGTGDWR